ncbi:MAG: transglutaminaseTgpA domain-containing protein [Nitrospirota bacterium]
MPQIYKILTALLAFAGCTSLVITGELNPLFIVTGTGLFPGYYRVLKGMSPAPKWAVSSFAFLTLAFFLFDSLVISGDSFLAVAHLTITFQVIKSFDLKEPWDHLQVYFMALLQLIVASELTSSLAFGIIFLLFLVAFVAAMVISHFMKEGTADDVGFRLPVFAISALVLLLTILFFVSLPRVSARVWGKSHMKSIKTVGFSERVDFGSFGDIKSDPTVVMRVELSGAANSPYYLRGMTLDYFNGISWVNTLDKFRISKTGEVFVLRPFTREDAMVQKIFLEAMDTDVLFGMSEVAAVEWAGYSLTADRAYSLFLPFKKGKRFTYLVYSIRESPSVPESDMRRNMLLPPGMEDIFRLAGDVTDPSDSSRRKAEKIEQYLLRNYAYSLSVRRPPDGISPVDDFLFNTKTGYCEHYATAMVLMLRSLGIPSRMVTGFVGSEVNDYGGYLIIRQSNAHSWVEAGIDGVWKRYDPTPPVFASAGSGLSLFLDMIRMQWNRYVIGFSVFDQRDIARFISLPFYLQAMPGMKVRSMVLLAMLAVLPAGLMLLWVFSALRGKRYHLITRYYLRFKRLVRKRGGRVTASSTPAEVKYEAEKRGLEGRVSEFVTMYEEHRFGGKAMNKEEKSRYRMLLKELER